jgi:6-phospho-3-hexuloisomerase
MSAIRDSLDMIVSEVAQVSARLTDEDVAPVVDALRGRRRVYLAGHGRSGLVARAFAMRLMHLGWTAYIVGDTLTPAIQDGDLLVALSGSGSSDAVDRQLTRARQAGAQCILVTASPAKIDAVTVIRLPIGHDGITTRQHAGSLFEQSSLVLADAIARVLQDENALSDAELNARHSNLQ